MDSINENLWKKLRDGQISAIEDLYRLNYQVLYSYAYKLSGEKDLSKDCVQELFVKLWEKREHLNEVSRVRSYLLQSVWHSMIKLMKKRNKALLFDENAHYDIDVVFPSETTIIESQDREEKSRKLNHAINNLSGRQKQIIFMQYYEGLSIEEIQKITELKYQSIKNLTHRAMIVLRDSMNSKKKNKK